MACTEVYIRQLGKFKGFKIFLVDGECVRNTINDDFVLGGNPLAYDFVPKGEIWIANDTHKGEIKFIILHELFEYHFMSLGLEYDKAHDIANAVEAGARKHPKAVKDIMELL